jgi:hypothetical protein
MNLLSLDSNKELTINPAALSIPEFAAIWKHDTSPKKELAIKYLSYIYFLCDYSSVYQSYLIEEREDTLRKDFDIRQISVVLRAGVEKYRILQSTPALRFLESAIEALEATTDYFSNVNYDPDNGKPLYKLKEVTSGLKDASGIMDSLESLHEKVKKELQSDTRIRGGGSAGAFES